MKLKLIIMSIFMLVISSGHVMASGDHDHGAHEHDEVEELMEGTAVNVGNKICPVSGEEIGSMGKAYHVEYEGKIYNLCCKMCSKDFKKNPEKYLEKVQEELENSEQGEHEDKASKGSHKGSHKDKHSNDHDGHDH